MAANKEACALEAGGGIVVRFDTTGLVCFNACLAPLSRMAANKSFEEDDADDAGEVAAGLMPGGPRCKRLGVCFLTMAVLGRGGGGRFRGRGRGGWIRLPPS